MDKSMCLTINNGTQDEIILLYEECLSHNIKVDFSEEALDIIKDNSSFMKKHSIFNINGEQSTFSSLKESFFSEPKISNLGSITGGPNKQNNRIYNISSIEQLSRIVIEISNEFEALEKKYPNDNIENIDSMKKLGIIIKEIESIESQCFKLANELKKTPGNNDLNDKVEKILAKTNIKKSKIKNHGMKVRKAHENKPAP